MSIKMRRSIKIALIVIIGLVLICYFANQRFIQSHKYLKNKYGETYGIATDAIYNGGKEPDLIKAIGTDGKSVGYVRSSDLNGFQPKNPEEALEYMAKLKEDRIIPLYDYNGEKVIDEFRISLPNN